MIQLLTWFLLQYSRVGIVLHFLLDRLVRVMFFFSWNNGAWQLTHDGCHYPGMITSKTLKTWIRQGGAASDLGIITFTTTQSRLCLFLLRSSNIQQLVWSERGQDVWLPLVATGVTVANAQTNLMLNNCSACHKNKLSLSDLPRRQWHFVDRWQCRASSQLDFSFFPSCFSPLSDPSALATAAQCVFKPSSSFSQWQDVLPWRWTMTTSVSCKAKEKSSACAHKH